MCALATSRPLRARDRRKISSDRPPNERKQNDHHLHTIPPPPNQPPHVHNCLVLHRFSKIFYLYLSLSFSYNFFSFFFFSIFIIDLLFCICCVFVSAKSAIRFGEDVSSVLLKIKRLGKKSKFRNCL